MFHTNETFFLGCGDDLAIFENDRRCVVVGSVDA
jgi:hypothetical protein